MHACRGNLRTPNIGGQYEARHAASIDRLGLLDLRHAREQAEIHEPEVALLRDRARRNTSIWPRARLWLKETPPSLLSSEILRLFRKSVASLAVHGMRTEISASVGVSA